MHTLHTSSHPSVYGYTLPTQLLPPRHQRRVYLNRRVSSPMFRFAAVGNVIDLAHAIFGPLVLVLVAERVVAEQAC